MKRLLKQFWSWCDTSDALPKSGFGKAIKYAQDQRPYLNAILQYGAIDWSNNATERNIKSYVMGRKNFLFSGVPEGAKANAILMTMIETAKANGLDPMTYIGSLLDELAQFPEWRKSSDLGDYLPWNYPKLMNSVTRNDSGEHVTAPRDHPCFLVNTSFGRVLTFCRSMRHIFSTSYRKLVCCFLT